MLINRGFDMLKNRLPISDIQAFKTFENKGRQRCRLTKVDILKLTIGYIRRLALIIAGDTSSQISAPMRQPGKPNKERAKRNIKVTGHVSAKNRTKSRCKSKVMLRVEEIKQDKPTKELLVQCSSPRDSDGEKKLPRCYLLSWSEANRQGPEVGSGLKDYIVWTPAIEQCSTRKI